MTVLALKFSALRAAVRQEKRPQRQISTGTVPARDLFLHGKALANSAYSTNSTRSFL